MHKKLLRQILSTLTKGENRSYKKSQRLLNKTKHGAQTTAQFKVKPGNTTGNWKKYWERENSCFRQTPGDFKLELDIYRGKIT